MGGDPSATKAAIRAASTVKELFEKFMEDYSKPRSKPSTQRGYQDVVNRKIVPIMGRMKVQDVKRPDVAGMMKKMARKPAEVNRTFSVMRKMFDLAEAWGFRADGTNPCRHVPMYPNGEFMHLINDEEMGKLFRQLDHIEAEGLESYVIPLAICLQFDPVMLVSGRYAMLDDGMGFSKVPWKTVIEQRLGQSVTATP